MGIWYVLLKHCQYVFIIYFRMTNRPPLPGRDYGYKKERRCLIHLWIQHRLHFSLMCLTTKKNGSSRSYSQHRPEKKIGRRTRKWYTNPNIHRLFKKAIFEVLACQNCLMTLYGQNGIFHTILKKEDGLDLEHCSSFSLALFFFKGTLLALVTGNN